MSKIIGLIVVIIIAAGAGWIIYNDASRNAETDFGDFISEYSTDNSTDSFEDNTSDKVEILLVDKPSVSLPELKHLLQFPQNFTDDMRDITTDRIVKLNEELTLDPTSFANWLALAIQRKLINDFEGARDIWEYLNIIYPKNSISFHNLGDLHHFYLKDYPKSEENFKKAIENSPNNVSYYINLHELYKYSYKKDTTLAIDALLDGLKVNPGSTDLLVALAVYYKEAGDNINAKKYYQQARNKAQEFENDKLVELLNTEIENLQ
ncbi:MAG: hypothetical protein QF535_22255 [Anaerolineales bacterium]|jgi:tetratricopeptide (TPR) repeat protein|nr:hypothetical protein [Anaerolineales bacterium]|tara:strand:+ start:389 stop:1180 length:792 start_codon:yes stop_codon:yes gene_type:complete